MELTTLSAALAGVSAYRYLLDAPLLSLAGPAAGRLRGGRGPARSGDIHQDFL